VSDFPQRLEFGSVVYTLRPDLRTAHVSDEESAAQPGSPVYESPDGALVYPTGKVWIRFAKGTDAHDRAADLAAAGFTIESVPGYAPHGAFVVAGDAATALNGMEQLRAMEGVEHVEPQVLREASRR
jgi:hypothetical protein